jgi:hypothetical protein
VIDVPVVNGADPVMPTATLIPAGLDVTRSALRPVAVTVNVAVPPGGGGGDCGVTVSVAVFVTPPKLAVIVTGVEAVTALVITVKLALVAPAEIVTLAGTVAAGVLLLASVMTAPPEGAAPVSVTVACDVLPPTTLVGFTDTEDKLAAVGALCGVKRRVEENGPNTPAEFRARTRHHKRCAGRPPMVACETLTISFAL